MSCTLTIISGIVYNYDGCGRGMVQRFRTMTQETEFESEKKKTAKNICVALQCQKYKAKP